MEWRCAIGLAAAVAVSIVGGNASAAAKTVVVDYDGGRIDPCLGAEGNSCSDLLFGDVEAFSGNAQTRAEIIAQARVLVRDFDISITDVAPESGDFDLHYVGDSFSPQPPDLTLRTFFSDCADEEGGEVTVTLAEGAGVADIAARLVRNSAFTWGMVPSIADADLLREMGPSGSLEDECLPVSVLSIACAEQRQVFCPPGEQNSYQMLLATFGSGTPDTSSPLVEVLAPTSGSTVDDDFELRVSVTDQYAPTLFDVTIRLHGEMLDEQPAPRTLTHVGPAELVIPVTNLRDGAYTLVVEAHDESRNSGSAPLSFTVGMPNSAPDADAPQTPPLPPQDPPAADTPHHAADDPSEQAMEADAANCRAAGTSTMAWLVLLVALRRRARKRFKHGITVRPAVTLHG